MMKCLKCLQNGIKGTGKWTIQESAEVSVAAPTISGLLNARFLSGIKDEKVKASNILHGPEGVPEILAGVHRQSCQSTICFQNLLLCPRSWYY